MINPKVKCLIAAALFTVVTCSLAYAQERTPPKRFNLIEWNGGKFVYGADYYPEHWDESQWVKDAEMMQGAGMNFVRLAEFDGHLRGTWISRGRLGNYG